MKTPLALAVVLVALASPGPAAAQAPATFADTCRVDTAQPQASLAGKVTDQAGAPVGGATVTLACGAVRQSVRTVGDGTYRFTAHAGKYQIEVDAPGLVSQVLKSPYSGSRRRIQLSVTVKGGRKKAAQKANSSQ